MRVLVAFEDDYRAYREVIAVGLRILHDQIEATTSTIGELEEVIQRFRPDVVICGGPEDAEAADVFGRIELNVDPTERTKVRLGACRWESTNPDLEALAGIIRKAELALRA
jgi:hypothetical protein